MKRIIISTKDKVEELGIEVIDDIVCESMELPIIPRQQVVVRLEEDMQFECLENQVWKSGYTIRTNTTIENLANN